MFITPTIELLAAPRVSAAKVSTFIQARDHGDYDDAMIEQIVNEYFVVCQYVYVDPLVALAQMIYETDNLTSPWAAVPHCNPINLGVTGEPEVGLSFASWERSIRVHVGRLLAYALTDEQTNGEQWGMIGTALYIYPLSSDQRGSAKTFADLAGTWSNDAAYGDKLTAVANDILRVDNPDRHMGWIRVERGMYEQNTTTDLSPSAPTMTDALTGLYTRVYMEVSLDREIHQALRKGTEIGIVILNLDEFRDFNETLGYTAGDTILHELGLFLFHSVRRGDIACRYGGDAFVLVLPDASLSDTRQRAEEIREMVKGLKVTHKGQTITCNTVSVGVAAFPRHGTTAQALLQAAAQALYEAKQGGRNRVVVA